MKPQVVGLLILLFWINGGFAQDLRQRFNESLQSRDTVAQLKLLREWEKTKSGDPELSIAWFNHFFFNAKVETLHLGENPEGKDALVVRDSAGNSVSFLSQGEVGFDVAKAERAIRIIDGAISRFPKRLDMRFGKIYALGEMHDWRRFTEEIISTIDQSHKIGNKWQWTDGKPADDAKNFMLGSIQGYFNQLYETGDDGLLENMERIAEAVLRHYPDDVMNLSNLSILKVIGKRYDEALVLLKKAEKLAPADTVILGNLALVYTEKGQKENAIAYYQKMADAGNDETKAYAETRIEKLKSGQ
ncbi:tetratricopeptide repeat protein [Flavobacterium selenitireducens]|uniref:tetratricopeptide repeat protein n=1 Tax=Flavobacterium selenitireducens TaxID=2722704 RepID=UPI00168A4D91|nr:tetratricopeptide repeat protein [Flavobacterium selenitireducens]MBD3581134.1 tetratricopeptide repeat protein [Flavobacterium selenitireducens]